MDPNKKLRSYTEPKNYSQMANTWIKYERESTQITLLITFLMHLIPLVVFGGISLSSPQNPFALMALLLTSVTFLITMGCGLYTLFTVKKTAVRLFPLT